MLKIIFEFVGGPYDGRTLEGESGQGGDAERYYLLSNRGTIGQHFKVASPYAVDTLVREQLKEDRRHAFQRHFYRVTDRLEEGGQVWVRATYVPEMSEPRPKA